MASVDRPHFLASSPAPSDLPSAASDTLTPILPAPFVPSPPSTTDQALREAAAVLQQAMLRPAGLYTRTSATQRALALIGEALAQSLPSARHQGGQGRLDAAVALWQLHTRLGNVPPGLQSQTPAMPATLSLDRMEMEAVATARFLFDQLVDDVYPPRLARTSTHEVKELVRDFKDPRQHPALLQRANALGRQAKILASQSALPQSFVSLNDVAEKCSQLANRLVTSPSDDVFAYTPHSAEALMRRSPSLPSSSQLPALAFAKTDKRFDADGAKQKVLLVPGQATYALEPKMPDRAGAYGKVARVDVDDGHGLLGKYIVKIQRTERKLALSPTAATQSVPLMGILQRTQMSTLANERIDASLNKNAALFAASTGPLRGLGADGVSTQLHSHFVDEFGKYYQIMPAMAGDLVDLGQALFAHADQQPLALPTLQAARTLVAAQLFSQLAAMHNFHPFWRHYRNGLAHRDLKPSNIVFAETGAVRLIDFDESIGLTRQGQGQKRFVRQGSIVSPEMDLSSLRKDLAHGLGAANDVWALGASLLDLGFTGPQDKDFLFYNGAIGQNTDPAAFGVPMATFVAWHTEHIGRHAALSSWPLPPLDDAQSDRVVARAHAVAHWADQPHNLRRPLILEQAERYRNFFNLRHRFDPELTLALLNNALQPEPARRLRAQQLARHFLQQARAIDDEQRARVAALFASAKQHSSLDL